ncbi:putative deacetylase LmbE-like domain [Pseudocohnilembus persalinus]|uniref:Putative deacetylase LmbE-like domain n=1 Tax=Pseudocohnilembus persalinus TaxID=266149 RepID=A0A0V0QJ53_PSEPJ|nr:putative deacetylase LmbE-like domain [Pseudocohnilembus persalinus]|eukprot:KRX02120.1 putative deacetylase LmbE-like domain [Pseudocohnilembus persalinus]
MFYWKFMHENLFDHIDILPENVNIPDGTVKREELENYCKQYEKKIIALGGLDFQLLGIGRSGHIGFNEPGSSVKCVTRLVHLDKITRTDAASDFMGLSKVPRSAITMGIATILSAKRIILLAWNENKSKVVTKAIEGPITENVPASYLQLTQAAECVIDKPAAVYLTRNQCPWTIKGIDTDPFVEYNDFWMIKAIIWLCKKTGKPILRLTEKDYEDNGLIDLVYQRGNGQSGVVNMLAYEMMKSKISGWPAGGRPNISSTDYFTQAQSTKKERILIFSPHPDDDVICMGGTMEKLIRQGHDVHVSYQTSGNLAVFDHDAERFNDFVLEYANIMGLSEATRKEIEARKTKIQRELDSKQDGQFDTEDMRKVKTIIRRTEAKMGAMECGVKKSQIYHLDLPFYESGSIKKKPLGEEDIQIVKNLIQKINPTMLFCAGDLTDPHGTHRVCLQAILKSLDQLQAEQNFLDTCQVLLYRGAWQEWDLEMVELAVPMSPEEVLIKRDAIYRHESQKDRAMFPGSDAREFWQRAEDRNRQTAELFKDMGLTQYQAIECFVSLQTLKTQNGI